MFNKAAPDLGMRFPKPGDDGIKWVEIPPKKDLINDGLDRNQAERESCRMIHCIKESALMGDMQDEGSPMKNPELKLCFVLIQYPDQKKDVKKYLDRCGIVSQFMVKKTLEKNLDGRPKMGIFTNLLRQVNAKMPMDLYRITLPDKVRALDTMFIGIDVCHKGHSSIVGLAATSSPDASQHFCMIRHQLLNQELVGKGGPNAREDIEWDKTKRTTDIFCDFVLKALKNF